MVRHVSVSDFAVSEAGIQDSVELFHHFHSDMDLRCDLNNLADPGAHQETPAPQSRRFV